MNTARDDYQWLRGVDAERALNEIDRLRRWKAEALTVLAQWDLVWEAAGRPGTLGSSKAANTLGFVETVQTQIVDLREQNRRLGDEIDRW